MEVDSELIGRRVTLRFRVRERAGRPLHRDAVGGLGADGDDLAVAGRRGRSGSTGPRSSRSVRCRRLRRAGPR